MTKVPNHSKYSVTEDGRIYTHKQRSGWITGATDRLGYKRLNATNDDGKRSNLYIHRAVAMAFIPNPENKPHVNHKDSNPSNNHVSNLEWCTHTENMQHSAKAGRKAGLSGEKNPAHKYTESIVKKVREMYSSGCSQMDIKRALGIPQPTVSVIVRGVRWRSI